MNVTEIRGLIGELIDDNPFAIRAVLKVLRVEFTSTVPTLAVTAEERPRLLINLEFVTRECRTPEHVKAVLCHEFLHVLLRHTSLQGPLTPERHLALDAVINAIIHRQLGVDYSSFMSAYYRQERSLKRMLRPMTSAEQGRLVSTSPRSRVPSWWRAWKGLYDGKLVADDIEDLAKDLSNTDPAPGRRRPRLRGTDRLLGNHADDAPLPEVLAQAIERARREMNGGGVWRGAGPGGSDYRILIDPSHAALAAWKAKTLAVLRKHLVPAPGAPRTTVPVTVRLPVLSPSDRRAFVRAAWSPFLPEADWSASIQRPEGRAQVYLDVSGSMNAEMPMIVALLGRLAGWIQRPFWAFSTEVAPAVIERGQLRAATTGGTSLACVLKHVELTRPSSAVIVTDGYVESLRANSIARLLSTTRLHAIVTRDGNAAVLRQAGLPYTQLARLPQ
jgi:hypothetical protein